MFADGFTHAAIANFLSGMNVWWKPVCRYPFAPPNWYPWPTIASTYTSDVSPTRVAADMTLLLALIVSPSILYQTTLSGSGYAQTPDPTA